MSSITDKLNYLNETKSQIMDALVAQGVEISETDTFRSYATKISEIAPNIATVERVGVVKPDGTSIEISEDGTISVAEGNFDSAVAPLAVANVENKSDNLSSYSDGQYLFLNDISYSLNATNMTGEVSGNAAVLINGTNGAQSESNDAIKPNAHALIRRQIQIGDVFNIDKRYTDETGTPKSSTFSNFVMGTIDADNFFTPKIWTYYAKLTVALGNYTITRPASNRSKFNYSSGQYSAITPNEGNTSFDYIDTFTIEESDSACVISATVVKSGEASSRTWNLGYSLSDLNINCIILFAGCSNSTTTPNWSKGNFKTDECWVKDINGNIVWKIGDITRGKYLQLLYDKSTLSVDGNKLTAVLPEETTLQGNTFNGANQLVMLDENGALPAIDGSQLTGISSSGGSGFTFTKDYTNSQDTDETGRSHYLTQTESGLTIFGGSGTGLSEYEFITVNFERAFTNVNLLAIELTEGVPCTYELLGTDETGYTGFVAYISSGQSINWIAFGY